MYGQLHKSVQVCSRCLRWRLHHFSPRIHLQFKESYSTASSSSEATVARPDRDVDGSQSNPDDSGRRRKQNSIAYRHFRPYKSAQLGHQSLGKPAEVIILPSRDRKILDTPVHDSKQENGSIHEVYKADSKAVSWEEIRANLHTVRDSIIANEGTSLEPVRWNKLKSAVRKGFTRDQLAKYSNEHAVSWSVDQPATEIASKQALTVHIMEKIWKLMVVVESPDQPVSEQETVEESESTTDSVTKKITKKFTANKLALEMALAGKGQILRDISEQYGVQIDVYRDKSRVCLTGDRSAAKQAKAKLKRLTKAPYQRSIKLSDSTKALARTSAFDTYLRSLMEKHFVRIASKDNQTTIVAVREADIDAALQELTKVGRLKHRNAGFICLDHEKLSAMARPRIYLTKCIDLQLLQQKWFRYRRGSPKQRSTGPLTESDVKGITENVHQRLSERRLPTSEDLQHVFTSHPYNLKSSLTAELGKSLFNKDKKAPMLLQSAFTVDIPLLPQALASKQSTLKLDSQESLLFLQLRPRENNVKLPSIEIYMSCGNINQGMKQALKMTRVTISLGSAVHDILLPSEQLDIRLTKTAQLEVFNSNGMKPHAAHLSFLKSLAALIENIQTSEQELTSGSLLHLDLTPLFNEPPELANLMSPSQEVDGSETETQISAISPQVAYMLSIIKRRKATTPLQAAYFLDPPEWIDKTRYSIETHPDVKVEHVIAAPLNDDGGVSRHALTLVPSSSDSSNDIFSEIRKNDNDDSVDSENDTSSSRDDHQQQQQLDLILPAAIDLAQKLSSIRTNPSH